MKPAQAAAGPTTYDATQISPPQYGYPIATSAPQRVPILSSQYSVERRTPDDAEHEKVKREKDSPDQLHSAPKYNVDHQSICFFVNLFCYQGQKRYDFPVLDFLPSMMEDFGSDSAASKAALAVSRMSLADQYSGTDVRLQTGHEYGEALVMASKRLRDPTKAYDDDTFLAVWLLSTYEAVQSILNHRRIGQTRTLEEEWQSHISHVRGAMQLMKMRGSSQLRTPQGEKMYRVFKAAIQMRLFILNSVTSREFDEMEMDVWKEEHEFTPSKTANTATAFFHKVARLIEKINAFLFARRQSDDDEAFIKQANEFISYGESVDKEMVDWSKHEDYWDSMPIQSPAKGTTWAIYPTLAQCWFFSPWVYLYWIRFHIGRLKLYEALIELSQMNATSPAATEATKLADSLQIESYKLHIRSAASALIGMTAYAIGDVSNRGTFNSAASGKWPGRTFQEINVVAALQLVIPLKACLRSEHTTADQKGAIDLAITHIGDGLRRQPLHVA
ncbi:uncharacterized protein AB675_2896 [Cyphellophora attinorum]|uniref:Transcription factor domain-containing protein n=1 Tax=Cyphellophora attinorum TaxID=1664694 RepID=A0A0N0NJ34_9EURO|nr:uncharacterized protein AB675_2896 [Phialophora attinorum]KPI36458.1 hypothetical protein AB675_2896 [Phialophora attinorum]